jgi:hypothetical protein
MLKKLVATIAIAAFVAASCSNKYGERSRRQPEKAESRKEKIPDTAAYRRAADYVIAYYIKAYIDKKTSSDYKEGELKNEWDTLQSNSFEKPVAAGLLEQIIEKIPPKVEELSKEGVIIFYNEIKGKRENYSKEWTKEEHIENLVDLPDKYKEWFKKGFKQYRFDGLRSELDSLLPEAKESKNTPPLSAGKAQRDSSSKSGEVLWWWRFAAAALAALGIALAIRKRRRPKKAAHPAAAKSTCLDIKDAEAADLKRILSNPDKLRRILKNEQLCRLWVESSLKHPEIANLLKAELSKREKSAAASTPAISANAGAKIKIEPAAEAKKPEPGAQPAAFTALPRYADAISGDFFNRVCEQPNEDTVFELNLQARDLATFTVYRNAHNRVIKRPEFLNGCDKQVIPNGRTIKTERQGEAQRLATGRWRIVKKLNVTIE